ncbi:hypothetical protein SBADM41S_01611 [Streptomyces badius]
MLMRTDPFRELDRITEQLLRPGTWSRPSAMPMDAYREGDEYVVAFDFPASRRMRSTSTSSGTC